MASFSEELAFALEATHKAAEVALGRFGGDLQSKQKSDGTWATEADWGTEAALREQIGRRYPDHNILGEEEGLTAATGGPPVDGAPMWVIDPIDGTNNYMASIPIWATLVGLRMDGDTVLGVVHAPALGETYHAAVGGGAFMNGSPISVDDVTSIEDALVVHAGVRRLCDAGFTHEFLEIVADARRDRGFGDFWGHMLVARGAASVMLEPELSIWDVAALQPIVSEAGGRLTTFDGDPWISEGSVLTTNGTLHDSLVARLSKI
ncbi:MAG: inositol monophosphatase family protein [Actinomycetota bacterium]